MAFYLLDWLGFAFKWLHITAGIAWVGVSFYFIWIENVLVREGPQRQPGLAGHLWAIHGGGFYYLEKYKTAPAELPPQLHWFKWEAYVTWLSGMALMAIIYYVGAKAWLVSPEGGLSPAVGIAVSIAVIVGGWIAYVGLCRTFLLAKPVLLGAIGLAAIVALTAALGEIFSARAVFLHIGAMLGTVMAGNVLFVIIPSQKSLVAAAERGAELDAELSRRAGLCSLHNNYLTLPVILLMASNHYPAAYNHSQNWLVLAALAMSGVLLRHFFNLRNRAAFRPRWLMLGALAFVVAIFIAAPKEVARTAFVTESKSIGFNEVRKVIKRHCVSCHSASPTDSVFQAAPMGFTLDTDEQIRASVEAIHRRVLVDRSMPFNNQTGMTEDERLLLARWIEELPSAR